MTATEPGAARADRATTQTTNDTAAPVDSVSTGALPRLFWFLCVGMFINRLGGSVLPFLSLYLTKRLGFSAALAGTVVGLYAAGGMTGALIGGALSDRIGRRPVLLCACASAATAMVALGSARHAAVIVLLAPILGFFSDMGRPALQAAVADVVPLPQRPRAFGYLYWSINLGFAGAAATAGLLAELGFGWLFAVDAATTAIFGTLLYFAVPETRPAANSAAPHANPNALAPLRDRGFVSFAAIQMLTAFVFFQGLVTLPLDMGRHGLSMKAVGSLLALNGVVIVLVQPFALGALARVRRASVLALGAAMVGLGFALSAAGASLYGPAIVVWTLGEIAVLPSGPALVAELAPDGQRGAYQGVYQFAFGAMGVVAPIAGPALLDALGPVGCWCAFGLLGLLSAGLHLKVTARMLRNR